MGTVLDTSGMRHKNELPNDPVSLTTASRCLRIPATWLRAEVEAGRLPGLVCGRSVLVHLPTIAAILADRAKGEGGAA